MKNISLDPPGGVKTVLGAGEEKNPPEIDVFFQDPG